jgi:Fic family protein
MRSPKPWLPTTRRITAGQAVDTVQRRETMARSDRDRIQSLGRAAGSALQVHHELLRRPLSTSPELTRRTGLTALTVNRALAHLANPGIVRELTGHKRNRIFSYAEYPAILNEGTELPDTRPATRNPD